MGRDREARWLGESRWRPRGRIAGARRHEISTSPIVLAQVVSAVEVTYNLQDERELAADGFEKLPENLLDLGFGDMFIWIKKINRNLETNVENEETILNELKAARKELKKREDDPILLDKIKALKLRLEKVKQESDFRDEYKDDPSLTVSRERHAAAATPARCVDGVECVRHRRDRDPRAKTTLR